MKAELVVQVMREENSQMYMIERGACQVFNPEACSRIRNLGIQVEMTDGIPKDKGLPEHCIGKFQYQGDYYIIDLFADQFWAYGIGEGITDSDKGIYSMEEYKDIYNSYTWRL